MPIEGRDRPCIMLSDLEEFGTSGKAMLDRLGLGVLTEGRYSSYYAEHCANKLINAKYDFLSMIPLFTVIANANAIIIQIQRSLAKDVV